MEQPALQRLLQNVANTEEVEISCAECFALVPQYVDLEVAGQLREPIMRRLLPHLRQCAVCREEYEVLRDVVRLSDDREAQSGDAPSA